MHRLYTMFLGLLIFLSLTIVLYNAWNQFPNLEEEFSSTLVEFSPITQPKNVRIASHE